MERHESMTRAARYLFGAATFAAAMFVGGAGTAAAQTVQDYCAGEIFQGCGFVFNDANNNGIQDPGEGGIEGVTVTFDDGAGNVIPVYTNSDGFYRADLDDVTYTVTISTSGVLSGFTPSPQNAGEPNDDTIDSDGFDDGLGTSSTSITVEFQVDVFTDFGFHQSTENQPGTGTPGYWKNHPDAWPVSSITIGGITYTKAKAIEWLGKVSKDKTTTMFSSLVSAKLNVIIGNEAGCIAGTILAADAWMASNGPVGSDVRASTAAWAAGEPLHKQMDEYNNGRLCAPHRN
ncbi:MAG TPA: SdrD B-like domain-containing protein [Vicinamibacterales bacterium]|nr:SdrD B-like domain-containing protein [Vicinamibacterales bacterium]